MWRKATACNGVNRHQINININLYKILLNLKCKYHILIYIYKISILTFLDKNKLTHQAEQLRNCGAIT